MSYELGAGYGEVTNKIYRINDRVQWKPAHTVLQKNISNTKKDKYSSEK